MTNKIDQLEKRLKQIQSDFNQWRNSGLNDEMLIIYLMYKTKLSRKKVKSMLDNMTEFFDTLILEETAKAVL